MSYMLSLSLNIAAVELADVGARLAALAQHGEIEDISMHLMPQPIAVASAQMQVSNGAPQGGTVVPIDSKPPRRPRKPANDDNTTESPGSTTPGSDSTATSTGSPGSGAVTVGETGGATSLPATIAVVAPPANVISVEELRQFCANAVTADGSRRVAMIAMLQQRGIGKLGDLTDDQRGPFYEALKKEWNIQ